jgi:hypothetical protein
MAASADRYDLKHSGHVTVSMKKKRQLTLSFWSSGANVVLSFSSARTSDLSWSRFNKLISA